VFDLGSWQASARFVVGSDLGCSKPKEKSTMGLKNWLAGKVAGPQSYGDVMGRHAREHGSALGNVVFLSHGIGPGGGPTEIFDTSVDMEGAGFKRRFSEITEIPLSSLREDERLLFRSLQRAMVSFAFIVNSNGALQNMRRENTSKFRSGLGPSLLKSMVECGLVEKIETAQSDVLHYANSVSSATTPTVLNMERPGSGDILEQFIKSAVAVSGVKLRYGFTRTGLTGFDLVAVPLVEETLKSIAGATLQYKW
jgi:hypothetical protein